MDKRRIGVRAIIYKDGKLLANKFHSKGGESVFWATPGGGLDPGESLTTGLQRELIEETGIKAQIGRLLFIQQFTSERDNRDEELEFFFYIENAEAFAAIDLNQTSHGALELTRCEFIDPRNEVILPSFLRTIDIDDYINNVRPIFIHNEL
jgi:ADP-ribose pyrophosphatase YjhB (NUDIX family)